MTQAILVGTDGSNGSGRALEFAMNRARLTGERIIIAYVIEWSPYTFNTPAENDERHRRREEELERAQTEVIAPRVEKVQAAGLQAQGVVRHGHAANTLSELAKEHDACIIVVGRRGNSKIKSLLFGSISGSLVQVADRPVTVVP